jgi:predicted enzyme related to lactoylglutathione lyase
MTPAPEPPIALYSVELRTSRWGEMVAWYRSALGLRVLVRVVDEGYALIAAGSTRLALLAREETSGPSGRWSLGFEVDDLDAALRRLAAAGTVAPSAQAHAEGFREVIVGDPDGNRVRLFEWPRH